MTDQIDRQADQAADFVSLWPTVSPEQPMEAVASMASLRVAIRRDPDYDDSYLPRSTAFVDASTDDDLPGMWSRSDFEGGDPDERSYAQREADRMLCRQQVPGRGTE